jgi:L-aminopeptidase/D-esterase-like protein
MLTAIEGVQVGHWTDLDARTGCTVVLLPDGTVASGEVRGGAPATREFELLQPQRLVDRVDAVVLSGGSAFGLAAADGVMQFLEDRSRGFPTDAGPVPIVVGLAVFDLLVGDPKVRPRAADGLAAAMAATGDPVALGRVGAGTGARTGTWRGREATPGPGGLGGAVVRRGEVLVAALVVVNAFGDIDDGSPLAPRLPSFEGHGHPPPVGGYAAIGNTTIGVVVTNAVLDKAACKVLADGGHDGLARALVPSHARVDGDAIVVAATGSLTEVPHVDQLRLLTVAAVEAAVRSVVTVDD